MSVVWAGADRELPLRIDALPRKFGIVFVFPVPGNTVDLEVPARRGLFLAADRRRIEGRKIGIHEGSCLAVALNERRQDYFGQTVNIASRVQGLATSTCHWPGSRP
jgi:class 3 adenylate cyclase